MADTIDFTQARWIHEPNKHDITQEQVTIVTEPDTDFWQRSYYGFRNDNAPALLLESAENFTFTANQMRIFHLHKLGDTTVAMGKANPPLPAESSLSFGVYACSPLKSSFTATFSTMRIEPCQWLAHSVE